MPCSHLLVRTATSTRLENVTQSPVDVALPSVTGLTVWSISNSACRRDALTVAAAFFHFLGDSEQNLRRYRDFFRAFNFILIAHTLLLGVRVWADAYDPPSTYYSAAVGTGTTLMQQLDNIMTAGHSLPTYGDARFLLDDTDEDPNNPANVLLFYNRMSVSETWNPNSNQFGTREHVWPSSRRPDGSPSNSTRNIGSDLHILKPLDASTNSSRGNVAFGPTNGSGSNGHQSGYYYPGNADRGDTARIIFYGGTRWKDEGLKVVNGQGNTSNYEMGDLASLIVWHFADPPDTFERRRNQLIYGFQGNRNAFIDRPEYAWSVYINQTNDSQIAIGGTTADANGGSVRNVDLGRVFVNGTVPAAQNFTLNKTGQNGTYFEVTTTGAAISSISGRYNAFRTNQTDSKSISVGLNTTTTSAGLRSGTVTVDNLDVTTMGGAGRGANDANDVFNVSLSVLDHAKPSFSAPSLATSLSHDFGAIVLGSSFPTFSFDVFNLNTAAGYTANLDFDSFMEAGDTSVLTTNLAASAGSLSLAGGTGQAFAAMLNTSAVGVFSATYTLQLSDEDIAGALNKTLTLTLTGQVIAGALAGDYDNNGVVDAGDYVVWRKSFASGIPLPYNETVSPGITDSLDYNAWRLNFGISGAGTNSGFETLANTVPESTAIVTFTLGMAGLHFTLARRRYRKS